MNMTAAKSALIFYMVYTPNGIEHSGLKIAYLIDPDGSLLRLVQND